MELILYTDFSKRRNSTKQPSGGTAYDVHLKAGCSVENPVFLIDGINLNVTYAEWNNAYYFIDDIIVGNNNIYEIRCSIDVLATFKTTIGAYTAFIERSASSFDTRVNDVLLSATQDIVYKSVTTASLRPYPSSVTGCFLIEVMNQNGIEVIACESLEPFAVILDPASYSAQNIIDWIDSKISQAFDLDVYIGGVRWVPFDPSGIGTQTTHVDIGPIQTNYYGDDLPLVYIMPQEHYVRTAHTLTLPTAYYDDFRQCNPRWTEYKCFLPGIGIVTLDSALIGTAILDGETVNVESAIDLISGDISYSFDITGNLVPFAVYKGNVSVSVPIGKTSTDIGRAFESTAAGVAGVATAAMIHNYAGAAVGAISTIVNVADNILTPTTNITGGSGNKGFILSQHTISLSTICYGSKEFPASELGRPLYEHKQINTLSGYIKCQGASLDSASMGSEKDEINRFLNNGFFYE